MINILVIDDEKDCCDVLVDFILNLPGCTVFKAYSGVEGLSIIKKNEIDVVFSDINMPDLNGMELLNLIKSNNYDMEIILISGKQDIINSINSLELGIYDFLTKPVDIYQIEKIIISLMNKNKSVKKITNFEFKKIPNLNDDELIYLKDYKDINKLKDFPGFVSVFSEKMSIVYQKLKKLLDFPDIPVLIEGATGAGKEIAARYMHYQSDRNNFPFIGVNCAAINKNIFESEFFGYVKGAFSGANPEGSDGYIKASENGTLFLDEISEIPVRLQAKLLRVLQEKEYYKVGGTEKNIVNTRIIFATNRDLEELVNKGIFRSDLFYRINICKITIPRLEERKDEIIPISIYFINEINKGIKNKIKKIEAGFFKKLLNYNWPGNIRELKNVITSILLFNDDTIIRSNSLKLNKEKKIKSQSNKIISLNDFDLPDSPFSLEQYNMKIVEKALKKFNGNKTKAAKFLNLSRIQLYKRFKLDK